MPANLRVQLGRLEAVRLRCPRLIAFNEALPDLKNLLNLRPRILRRAGYDAQVLRHLDLAAAVRVTVGDEEASPGKLSGQWRTTSGVGQAKA